MAVGVDSASNRNEYRELSKLFYYQLMHKRIVWKGVLKLQVPNSAADTHQQGPDNKCIHTARLTTMMYFNQLF